MVDGLNLYRYARNNPIQFADPTGTQTNGNQYSQTVFFDENNELKVEELASALIEKYGPRADDKAREALEEGYISKSNYEAVVQVLERRSRQQNMYEAGAPRIYTPIERFSARAGLLNRQLGAGSPDFGVGPGQIVGFATWGALRLTGMEHDRAVGWAQISASAASFVPWGRIANQFSADARARAAASETAPHIGTSEAPRAKKESPFNRAKKPENRENCVQCVTSLVDAIVNKSFVFPGARYEVIANFGVPSRALEYINKQTGVTFGAQQQNVFRGGRDFVVFTRIDPKTNKAEHVVFASLRGGKAYFYDPQSGAKSYNLKEPYLAYPIIYPEDWLFVYVSSPFDGKLGPGSKAAGDLHLPLHPERAGFELGDGRAEGGDPWWPDRL